MPKNTCARPCQTLACVHSHLPQSPQTDTKKTANSTIDVHKNDAIPPLLTLPHELLLQILGNLQDFEDVFSSILACRRIFDIFQEAQRPLIESTFAKYIHLRTDWETYRVLIQLSKIIRRDIVHRDIVRLIFETGWEIFRQRHQEELLVPFGRALAWSYVLNERQSDAIRLLQLIQKGEPPFGWSTRTSSQQPIQPIRELLDQLLSVENGVDRMYISSDLDHPLVEINGRSKPSLSAKERIILLKNGILFRENSIVMMRKRMTRKIKASPPSASFRPTFPYTLRYGSSIAKQTTNCVAAEVLAHQSTSSYAGEGVGQHGYLRVL